MTEHSQNGSSWQWPERWLGTVSVRVPVHRYWNFPSQLYLQREEEKLRVRATCEALFFTNHTGLAPPPWYLGRRIGRRHYIGRCTRTHHLAILRSDKGTYCLRHRIFRRRQSCESE